MTSAVIIIGGGAAGLATAIFAKRTNSSLPVIVLEGARHPGAKILVSGGSRCNVTNATVSERDYWGGRRTIIRNVLRALPVEDTVRFFRELGVPLHEEADGKLFPNTNRSRDVLNSLLAEVKRLDVDLRVGHRVTDVRKTGDGFVVETSQGDVHGDAVVLATGGLALPKSGSDGAGYRFAAHLGHTIVPTTPALAPLVVDADARTRMPSGVSQRVVLELRVDDAVQERIDGSLLWTHFGISGPAALDLSRHWLRAALERRGPVVTANLLPGRSAEQVDAEWIVYASGHPRQTVGTALGRLVADSVAAAMLESSSLHPATKLADLTREGRRAVVRALTTWPLAIADSRGYTFAEATAGGVDLTEIDPRTMQSRKCAGLYLAGEILDVDGRLGGFNFQWAWSSARVCGEALARAAGSG